MSYVHGYDLDETVRLQDQADTLVDLLHADTAYPDGSRVLEAGCGVGAQTITLARRSPGAQFLSVDISETSLAHAAKTAAAAGLTNVSFQCMDLFDLTAMDETFDHVFVCFVLEHLRDPVGILTSLKGVLKPGGSLTVIEGDHGSTYFHPECDAAKAVVQSQITLQARAGGDALVGRRLYPLIREAGFGQVRVSPRMVYVDSSKPALVDGFTRRTFTAMIEGVKEEAVASGLLSDSEFNKGIKGLLRTAEPDGVFCYTFFKATAVNQT